MWPATPGAYAAHFQVRTSTPLRSQAPASIMNNTANSGQQVIWSLLA
jgi:hypothetical protein